MRNLFFCVFAGEMDKATFERRFMRSTLGYSYHGLMMHGDEIGGSFSAIPYRYLCFGKQRLFALSVDTMISPQHRGRKTTLVTMANLVYEAMVKDGVDFIYGFPNELYYAHEKRVLGTRDIGKLNYYVLPINFGTAMQRFKILDYPGRLFARIMAGLPGSRNTIGDKYNIEKINDEQFIKHRYDESYSFLSLNNGARCVYKIYAEKEGVRTLHLLDVWPMTPAVMDEAVREVFVQYHSSVDLIMYVGRLPFRPRRLIKMPEWLEPQKIRMTGKMLVEGAVSDSILDINNWNVNVSNFDVR
ncbi:MAG: GNAT family N-acetyltransferase [Planctomycetota bacterium]